LPKILHRNNEQPPTGFTAKVLAFILASIPATMAMTLVNQHTNQYAELIVIMGLFVFGTLFAINSAVHSYLILAFADQDKVALNVGFYYMANAAGRLAGTVLSGFVYQIYGLVGCLWVSAVFILAAGLLSVMLPKQ